MVTGAASGIGLAYAEVMAEAGAKVTLLDIDGELLHEQVTRLAAHAWTCTATSWTPPIARRCMPALSASGNATVDSAVVFANAGIDSGAQAFSTATANAVHKAPGKS